MKLAGLSKKINPSNWKGYLSLKTKFFFLLTCLVTLSFAALAQTPNSSEEAQTFRTVNPQDLKVLPQSMAAEALGVHITSGDAINAVQAAGTTLPLCSMTDNGATFDVVGACPNVTGTTNIPITIVPVVLKITQGGKTFVFSPNATDPGCLGGTNTALSLFQKSPFFSSVALSFNGVSEGTTQYLDGLQNSAFATTVVAGHHTIFSPVTVGATLTVSVNAGTNGNTTAEVFSVGGTQCGTNTGTTNPAAKLAVININTLASHLSNANPGAFVFFEMYNSVMSNGAANNLNNCCILGFHNASGAAVNAPGATFGIGDFQGGNQTVFTGVADVSVISHEVAEWANDPSGNNPVPGTWGNIGQVSGCQGNFEVGDPLSGTLAPSVTGNNGFTYHFQDIAYKSWFYRDVPSTGAGGLYSSGGTFKGDSIACPPGGTN